MKVTIEATDLKVKINNSVDARIWEGETSSGLKVSLLISRISLLPGHSEEDETAMAREMAQTITPSTESSMLWPASVDTKALG